MAEHYNSSLESLLFTALVSIIVASPFVIAPVLTRGIKHPRLRADLASFSAGIFLGTVTFSIIEESVKLGDILTMGIGFGISSVTFSIIRYMKKNDKSSDNSSSSTSSSSCNDDSSSSDSNVNNGGSGQVIILGTLIDSHPETIIIGIIIALGMSSLLPTVLALFTGNFAARVVGTINMIDEGKSKQEVL